MKDAAPPLEALLVNASFVRGVARAILGADDRVDDVVQETWIIALRSGPHRPASLRAWLASIARRRAWRLKEQDAARERRELHAQAATRMVAVERIVEEEDTRRLLVNAVLATEEPCRSTLLLRYYQGLSIKQTAEMLQVPVETVRTRQRRGLERVRHRLNARYRGNRGAVVALLAPLAAASGAVVRVGVGGVIVKKIAAVTLVLCAVAAAALAPGWFRETRRPAEKEALVALEADATEAPVLEGLPLAGAALGEPSVGNPTLPLTLAGIVLDGESGEPLGGARVWLADDTRETSRPSLSDAAGTFWLPPPDALATHLCAYRIGYRPYCRPLSALGRLDEGLRVELDSGAREGLSIRGRVLDPAGRVIEGARVEAWGRLAEDLAAEPDGVFGAKTVPDIASATTDPNGYFLLRGLTDGKYLVRVKKEGYFDPTNLNRALPKLTSGEQSDELILRLRPLHVYRAIAVDSDTGIPLPFASYLTGFQGEDSYDVLRARRRLFNGRPFMNAKGIWIPLGLATDSRHAQAHVIVSAPGYARARAMIPAERYPGEGDPRRIPLTRESSERLVPVTFGANWPDGTPFTGMFTLNARVHNRERFSTIARFEDGVCPIDIPFPPGIHTAELQFGVGSTQYWGRPAQAVTFEIDAEQSRSVNFVLGGGAVLIEPEMEKAGLARQFWLSVEAKGGAGSLWTWNTAALFSRSYDGEQGLLLWLSPGRAKLALRKPGFEPVHSVLDVPGDGGVVVWRPKLEYCGAPKTKGVPR